MSKKKTNEMPEFLKKNYEMQDLAEHMTVTYRIQCDKCGQSLLDDDDDCFEGFYEDGWRSIDGQAICPACEKASVSDGE